MPVLTRIVLLPRPAYREGSILAGRREYAVVEVIEALAVFAQPELLVTDDKRVWAQILRGHANTETLIAPISSGLGLFEV
jgi:hypothetical protein